MPNRMEIWRIFNSFRVVTNTMYYYEVRMKQSHLYDKAAACDRRPTIIAQEWCSMWVEVGGIKRWGFTSMVGNTSERRY